MIDHPFSISLRSLTLTMTVCIALWLLSQIVIVLNGMDLPQISDALRHETLARQCADAGVWYPSPEQTAGLPDNPTYINYAGLINIIVLCIKAFGTYKAVFWLNILSNCVILASIYMLTKRLCGGKTPAIAAILYCLCPMTVFYVCETMSELPCMAMTFLSLALACRKRVTTLLAAGLVMAAAIYIRPVAALFAIAAILFMLLKRENLRRPTAYAAGAAIGCLLIVSFNTRISGGHRFLSSTTLGVNMLIGANDYCHGSYNDMVFDDNLSDVLTGRNVFECDSVYRELAYDWIRKNPGKWISLSLLKIKSQLGVDKNRERGISYTYFYLSVLYLATLCDIWIRRRKIAGPDIAVLFPFACGLALSVLTVGATRYNFPYIPCLIYFAAPAFGKLLRTTADSRIASNTHTS